MTRYPGSRLRKILSAVQRIASSFRPQNYNGIPTYIHHNYHNNHLPAQDARNRANEQHNKPYFNRRMG